MTVRDIRDVAPDVEVPVDVCIVGSGPAGMTIAHELAAAGRRVTVLESGGVADAGEAGDLSEIESVGAPRVMDQELVRVRGLGGTSRVWSGRIATFDETDFRERSWVPGSGWPLTRHDVGRYFARAARLLGGPVVDNNAPSEYHERATGVLPAFDPAVFTRYFWTFSSDPAARGAFLWFGRDLDACRRSDIEFVVNATVTQLVPDPVQQKIASVEVSGPDGRVRTFAPDVVILAAGGIENPRLLLASDRVHKAGVGNQHDQVGRYLMDHPRGPVASYTGAGGDRVARLFGNVQLAPISKVRDRRSATVGVALAPELQEAEGLLNCSMWVVPQRSPRDPLSTLQDIATRRSGSSALHDLGAGVSVLAQGFLDAAVRGRSPRRLLERLDLYCMVEQGPDPQSRVTLSSRRDRLGVPLARLDWRIGAPEARTVRRAAGLFSSEMARLGNPVPELAGQIADDSAPFHFPDIAHPTGTTRMSADPRLGVVDQNCRVHGLENLYVAGSSVFPTSGHANPTQMIVAMALRLADFVTRTHAPKAVSVGQSSATVESVPAETGAVAPMGISRVLVTGARGKVGRLLVTRLVERGYRVRALTSGGVDSGTGAPEPAVEWRMCDLASQQPFDDDVLDGVDAVVHLAALQRGEALQAVNVDATVALLDACERAGVALFCFLSSASVYGSPRVFSSTAEHARTLDEHSPVERQYWTNAELQAYGRSKKAAEEMIVERHKGVTHCVVFRPTVIVDSGDVQNLRAAIRRGPGLNPRALHLVHNEDVVSAILWALERTSSGAEAGVEIFNLADNDVSCRHESDVQELLDGGGHRLARTSKGVLKVLYWCGSAARFYRGGSLRLPLGLASYPNERLLSEGFTFTRGMRAAWIGRDADGPADASGDDSATTEPAREARAGDAVRRQAVPRGDRRVGGGPVRRVLINQSYWNQRITGQQRYATEIAHRLEASGVGTPIRPTGPWTGSTLRVWAWVQLALPLLARRDVVLSLTSRAPLWRRRHVLVVHDLFVLTNPEWFSRRYYWTHAPLLRAQIRSAAVVVAVSQPVADQVARLRSGPVVVAPNAPSDIFRSGPDQPAPGDALAARGLTPGSYFLTVGSRDPRKNLARLVEAYGRLTVEERRDHPLVVVGGGAAIFRDEDLIWPDGSVDAGYVSDEELSHLYAGARSVVFVSRAEGFGLPIVEAAAAGAPSLLVSDIDVFRWICGDQSRYVDPASVESIRDGLRAEIETPGRQKLDLDRFDWDASGAVIADACVRAAR